MLFAKTKAPEIIAPNIKNWINSEPLSLSKLSGKIILLDFWAYSCVNCLRTLPYLKEIWNKYKNKRFMLIGIHTPEFEFEKEIGNVKYAVKKYALNFPILSDPDRINWKNYGNTYWPRSALIDAEGKLIFEHIGESGYAKIESKIIDELKKINEIKDIPKGIIEPQKQYSANLSSETYAGILRNNSIGSSKVCTKEGCDEYFDQGKSDNYKPSRIYLHGNWAQDEEYLEYKGKEKRGYIAYKFNAAEVNVVFSGEGKAEVFLDNSPLKKSESGKDIVFEEGKSYVCINGSDMYNIVLLPAFQSKVLKILPFPGMKIYAYTFG